MRSLIKNKNGGFTDLFIFMIFAFILVVFAVVFVYISGTVKSSLTEQMEGMDVGGEDQNTTEVIDNSVGKATESYKALDWITLLLIVGMIVSIFIGSYLVTTKGIFFVPYGIITVIAIIVSIPISNTYEKIMNNPELSSTFAEFGEASFVLLHLPIWISIIGIAGGILMFITFGVSSSRQNGGYY